MNRLLLFALPLLNVGLTGCFILPNKGEAELQPVPGPPAAIEPGPADSMDDRSAEAMAPSSDEPAGAMTGADLDQPDDSLTIGRPPETSNTPTAPAQSFEPAPQPIRTYTIEQGDSFWKIAKKVYGEGMRMKDIEAANPGVNPMRLKVGDEIVLPD